MKNMGMPGEMSALSAECSEVLAHGIQSGWVQLWELAQGRLCQLQAVIKRGKKSADIIARPSFIRPSVKDVSAPSGDSRGARLSRSKGGLFRSRPRGNRQDEVRYRHLTP
jgi:hypothetical protein